MRNLLFFLVDIFGRDYFFAALWAFVFSKNHQRETLPFRATSPFFTGSKLRGRLKRPVFISL
jgi:hypothetical protein